MDVQGTVKNIVFRSEETGYTVGRLLTGNNLLTFVGTLPWIFEGQEVSLSGELKKHPSYGEQLAVVTAEEIRPTSKEAVKKYLASGIITGVGPVTAKRLVDHFGEKVFDILDHDMDRLKEVEGIGQRKLDIIKESYLENREVRNIMVFLQQFGVTPKQCMKIYYRYGTDSINVVSKNPYVLSENIRSFGFKTADKIAQNLGIAKDSPYRILSGVHYILQNYTAQGNTCMPMERLQAQATQVLEVEGELIGNAIQNLVLQEELMVETIAGDTCVFLPQYWRAEVNIAKGILAMATHPYPPLKVKLESFIEDFEKQLGIALHPKQKEAVAGAATYGMQIITGGPGTGKTTILRCILAMLEKAGLKVLLGAPTGRAAKRMSETTGKEASTIHRLLDLGVAGDEDEGDPEASDELACDVVIIDEASMIDVILMNNLMCSLRPGTRLILVGDADQLPSVGPGSVLADLMNSGACKVVKLDQIYRQGTESLITVNAHRINNGQEAIANQKDGDFFFLKGADQEASSDLLVDLIARRLPTWNGSWDPLKDMQVLSPMRKGPLGVANLNEKLKKILNPAAREAGFTLFAVGDKVMQNRNNYQLKSRTSLELTPTTPMVETGVFNGDVGYVVALDEEERRLTVLFEEDRYVDYTPQELDDLELAYAITIHKSQGSEFPVVVIPCFMGPPMLLNRNLIYTAVTRARKLVVLVGEPRALSFMIHNNRSFDRYTSLGERLSRSMAMMEDKSFE